MIKTLNPCPNPAKTAEIMSRYRPIAPKPEPPSSNNSTGSEGSSSSSISPKIKQSPYLRTLWPQLQARPTRTRKRGRALPSFKRHKPHLLGFCPPSTTTNITFRNLQGPPIIPHHLPILNTLKPTLVTLPLLPCSPHDLNVDHNHNNNMIPEEKDLLKQLQGEGGPSSGGVIAPQPVRPVGSSIMVGSIKQDDAGPTRVVHAVKKNKRAEEVEHDVECDPLPAVISDSNNKVRMANSAYREMVGQPHCPWLDSIVTGARIGGDVSLHLCGGSTLPSSSNGFSCWVRIDWDSRGNKCSVNAFCDVIRLSCDSRDYLFTWRFHTRQPPHSTCISYN